MTEAAIVDAITQVRGAFSFVMMTKDRIIGVRDTAWLSAARPRPAGRCVGDVFRDLRPGPHFSSSEAVKSYST